MREPLKKPLTDNDVVEITPEIVERLKRLKGNGILQRLTLLLMCKQIPAAVIFKMLGPQDQSTQQRKIN